MVSLPKFLAPVSLVILFSSTCVYSQVPPEIQSYRAEPKGSASERCMGTLNGNRVTTIFDNAGQIGQWPYQPSGVWPRGTDHSYLGGYGLLVAASVVAPGNNSLIHPVETFFYEETDADPVTGERWCFEPVPGYKKLNGVTPSVNYDPYSWPSGWGGRWKGMGGPDSMNASVETFFVMDDSKDAEWSRPPFNFYPVSADSERQGLGLRVEARGFQWSNTIAADILIFRYDIINLSDQDYDSTCVGTFVNPEVGGINASGTSARYDSVHKLVYAWCPSGIGIPGNWPTGYMGIAFLETPAGTATPSAPIGVAGFAIEHPADKSSTAMWPKNDDVIWNRMRGGVGDTLATNTIITMVLSTDPFALKKWGTMHFAVALMFADTLSHLFTEADIAREIASRGYHLPPLAGAGPAPGRSIPDRVELSQNFPNPFNPSTLIRYRLTARSHVSLTVVNTLGQKVAELVDAEVAAGTHEVTFDGRNLPSGIYFYRLRAGDYTTTRRLALVR